MFLEKTLSLATKEIIKLNEVASVLSLNDDVLSYLFTMNNKALIPLVEEYNKKIRLIHINHASEKDGKLEKDDKGNFTFSKENLKKVELEINKLEIETQEVKLLQLEINKSAAAKELSIILKTAFLGTFLTYNFDAENLSKA